MATNLEWNATQWGEKCDWKRGGAEWSAGWGSPETQWFASIYPRIHSFIPADHILELAPGFGRWTRFLLPMAGKSFRAVDMTGKCVEYCPREFVGKHSDFQAVQNDGLSLKEVSDRTYDFVFSFDSLVHASIDILGNYIAQILDSLLAPEGVCFLHHSNLGYAMQHKLVEFVPPPHPANRAPNSSAAEAAQAIRNHGGKVLCQEIISWGSATGIDCLTLFCRNGSRREAIARDVLMNLDFDQERRYAQRIFDMYRFDS